LANNLIAVILFFRETLITQVACPFDWQIPAFSFQKISAQKTFAQLSALVYAQGGPEGLMGGLKRPNKMLAPL